MTTPEYETVDINYCERCRSIAEDCDHDTTVIGWMAISKDNGDKENDCE